MQLQFQERPLSLELLCSTSSRASRGPSLKTASPSRRRPRAAARAACAVLIMESGPKRVAPPYRLHLRARAQGGLYGPAAKMVAPGARRGGAGGAGAELTRRACALGVRCPGGRRARSGSSCGHLYNRRGRRGVVPAGWRGAGRVSKGCAIARRGEMVSAGSREGVGGGGSWGCSRWGPCADARGVCGKRYPESVSKTGGALGGALPGPRGQSGRGGMVRWPSGARAAGELRVNLGGSLSWKFRAGPRRQFRGGPPEGSLGSATRGALQRLAARRPRV